jgi:peroxiredoxin Q/BCP
MSKFIFALLSLSAAAAFAIAVGASAPNFSAKNQDGKTVSLSDFKGKPVLLYFYPKDETPGCTKEACSFRDQYAAFTKQGAAVVGISAQDAKSHREFKDKHKLPFDLLVDSDGSIAKAFGVGKFPVLGLLKRQSVLLDKDGKVLKFYENVDPETHTEEVLKDLAAAKK